jgi:hypothetical protein
MAVNIFLANWLRTLSVVTGILSGRIAGSDVTYKIIDEFVIWGCSIGLLAFVWSGVNWARWLTLVLSTANIGLTLYRIAVAFQHQDYVVMVMPTIYVVLEGLALYFLFSFPGKTWFERRSPNVAA